LDTLEGMEAARKYTYQSDTKDSITVMCNKVENELYTDLELKKRRNKLLID
jgi:hypothetical protein